MATHHGPQQFFSVSRTSARKNHKKEQCHQQTLRQTAGLVRVLRGAVWLILTALFCALLLTGLIPCFHPTTGAWAEARTTRADAPLPSIDSRDTQIVGAVTPTLTVASSNPNSGVSITVSPNDTYGH